MTRKPSGEAAYDALMSSIREGVFQPGDRLREEDVARRLDLSRTPVREALRRLESERIVEHCPRIGAVIRKLDHSEVIELYEMRIVLERSAAELAAKHALAPEIEALEHFNAQIASERANPMRAAAINQDFHRGLYRAGRNRFLTEAARTLNNSLLLLGPTTYTKSGRIDIVVSQHQTLIDALRSGDPKAAGQAAEAHLTASLELRLQELVL